MGSQNLNSVFTAFPALPAAIVRTTATTLSNNVAQVQNWNNRQTLALSVWALIFCLNNKGGTNYKAALQTLQNDATTFMGGFAILNADREPGNPLDDFEAVCDWNRAYDLDSTIGTNLNTLLTNIGVLQDLPEATLRFYIIYLRYACSIKGA